MKNENRLEKLESALIHAGKDFVYPTTPPIVTRAQAQLNFEEKRFSIARMPQRLAIAATLTLVIALALVAIPETRTAFAQLLGLDSARVTSTWTPTMTIASTPSPLASLTTGATVFQPSSNLPTQSGTPSTQPSNIGIIDQMRVQTSPSPTRP